MLWCSSRWLGKTVLFDKGKCSRLLLGIASCEKG
jgi:hypothetical protein